MVDFIGLFIPTLPHAVRHRTHCVAQSSTVTVVPPFRPAVVLHRFQGSPCPQARTQSCQLPCNDPLVHPHLLFCELGNT